MDFEALKRKPSKLIMENNILDDVVYLNAPLKVLFNKIDEKFEKSFRDFLIVIINSKNEVNYIITYKEFPSFITLFSNFLGYLKKDDKIDSKKLKNKVEDLDLKPFSLNKGINAITADIEVQKALDIMNENNLEVLVVVNNENKYVGKIKRSSLKKRVDEVID